MKLRPQPKKALTRACFGARGTGKTAQVRQWFDAEKPPRLLVWDFKHDPGLDGLGVPVVSIQQLAHAAKAARFQLRYMVDHTRDVQEQFRLFCAIAWVAGNLEMFVDELPEVTKPGRAWPEWRRCVNVGRDYMQGGERKWLAITAAGQRLAETDKSFISNCDIVHVGRLNNPADCREVAGLFGFGLRPEDVAAMPDLHWIEKRADKPGIVRGVLTFGNKATPAKKKKPAAKKAPSGTVPKKAGFAVSGGGSEVAAQPFTSTTGDRS